MTTVSVGPCTIKCPASVNGVRLDISLLPSTNSCGCCGSIVEKLTQEADKLKDEADGLYKDNLALRQQLEALQNQSNAQGSVLESASELVKSYIKDKRLSSDPDSVKRSKAHDRPAPDNVSRNDASANCTERQAVPATAADFEGDTKKLKAENEQLKAQYRQALMLVEIRERQLASSNQERLRLEQKLAVLERTEGYYEEEEEEEEGEEGWKDKGDEHREGEPAPTRFQHEVCQLQECRNCRRFFEGEISEGDLCLYHSQRPLLMAEWLNLMPDLNPGYVGKYRDFRFWPCCDVLARKAPKGCKAGLHVLSAAGDRR